MLPRADLNSNRPPASLEAPTSTVSSTDARLEVFRRLTQIAIGKELQATVASKLDDGTYLVKVADAHARMALPVGARVGDTLSMVFVAKEPRPTFLLTQQQGSAPASLSTTARLIDHILQLAEQDGAPSAVLAKAPLAASAAAADPKLVAANLRNALAASGLFYESHLHDWISGGRSLAELAHEPQARFEAQQKSAHATPPQNPANLDLTKLAASMRELGDQAHTLMNLIRQAQQQAGNAGNTDADLIARSQAALPQIDPEAARIINLQLNTLEHQQVRWQGELWPGQPMEWEVREDKSEGGSQQEQQSAWTSVVRFELPHLGDISATIRLAGDRVHVQVNTKTEAAASSLREHSGMLTDRLEAAGAPLDSLLVKQDEAP